MKRLTCWGELSTTQEIIFNLETQQLSLSQILAFIDFKFQFPTAVTLNLKLCS